MIGITPEQAAQHVIEAMAVTREDIARAKDWIIQSSGSNTSGMVDDWLRQQGIPDVREVDTDAEDCRDALSAIARRYSVRIAFYHASWELIASGILIPPGVVATWEAPLGYRTSHGAGGIPLKQLSCPYPDRLHRLPFAAIRPVDVDIFLKGLNCKTLNAGIHEAIEQSLTCFRRGLYMPATVMLAAAVEATWTECGAAVATNLSDAKLAAIVADPQISIARIVSDVRKVLEHKNAKPLLQRASRSIHQVNDVEIWTTALRDRRNALHWGKAKSFVADHAETGTLLMAAPQHLDTLEAIRATC
jgi:hypothetical protein